MIAVWVFSDHGTGWLAVVTAVFLAVLCGGAWWMSRRDHRKLNERNERTRR